MALLDGLLGLGGDQSTSLDVAVSTNPQLGASLSDVLDLSADLGDSGGVHLVGIGDASIGFAAPTVVGVSLDESAGASAGGGTGGGLLGGLLGGGDGGLLGGLL